MDTEIFIALLMKKLEARFEALPAAHPLRGPRGQRGARGEDGRDGKDFDLNEHRELFQQLANEAALDFADLTAEQIEQLRGRAGRDGRDGKDGKDFNFEDHRSFFEGLKPKFSDFTSEEKDSLRLRFEHLSSEEKDSLKLRFNDLTEEDRAVLRGPRGARGQRGVQGDKGDEGAQGKIGPRGLPGVPGPVGRSGSDGRDGRNGEDGLDAPRVTDIFLESPRQNEIRFVFEFSDGSAITTTTVELPQQHTYYVAGGVASGGGGSGGEGEQGPPGEDGQDGVDGADGLSAYEIAVEEGFVGTESEWLASLVGPEGPQGPPGLGAGDLVASFEGLVDSDAIESVDVVDPDTFAAIEYAIALKMGTTRSFMKLVVQKSEGDFVDEFEEWDDIPDMDGPGAIVEKIWESAITLDIDLEANIMDDGMNLIFTNNEESTVQVSGTRTLVPDFV